MTKYIRINEEIYKINKVTKSYIYLIQLIVDNQQVLDNELFYKHYIDPHNNIVSMY